MKMPAFDSVDQNGKPFSSASLAGKKTIIFFYPRANTPTCTAQACNLRDNIGLLKKSGFTVVGISPDTAKAQKKFEKNFDLPFPLLADEKHAIADKFGVWGKKKFMGLTFDGIHRSSFLIDESGEIKHHVKGVGKNHKTENLLKVWNGE